MFEKILNFLGITHDVMENVRETTVDKKEDQLKKYEVDTSGAGNIFGEDDFTPTSKKDYEKNKKKFHSNEDGR